MKKLVLLIGCIGFLLGLQAQTYIYPAVPLQGAAAADFVPPNWKIHLEARGDLNKDSREDIALVLQCMDPRYIHYSPNSDHVRIDSNRRMMVVAFQNALGGYERIVCTQTFILRHESENMEDPMQDIQIHNGVLQVDFHYFMNMGSWTVSNQSFKFRWQDGQMALIGYDQSSISRNMGDATDDSYNFSTMKALHKEWNEFDPSVPEKEAWKKLPRQDVPSLERIGSPLDYAPVE